MRCDACVAQLDMRTPVLHKDELYFMNPPPVTFFKAALQTFFSSFLPTEAVTTLPPDPTAQPKQPHVLRTNPNRGPMPTENTITTKAVSIKRKKRENYIGRWLDHHDPMASDPIEVSDESDHANSKTSTPSYYRVERIPSAKPRKNATKQKQTRTSPPSKDGPRLFGDKTRPDPDGVPIPLPGAQTKSIKVGKKTTDRDEADNGQPGPLRPIDTLNNSGPFASKSVSRSSSHAINDGQHSNASPYFVPKPPKKQTPARSQRFEEEGPARKKPRLAGSPEEAMSRISPIVIDDDMEMGERDELALSSDKDQDHSARPKTPLFTRPSKVTNRSSISASTRIKEFHAVEDMMSPSSYDNNVPRRPLQVLQSNDSYLEGLPSHDSSEDELFTKKSRQQRLEAKGEYVPTKPPRLTRNGNLAAAESAEVRDHGVPEGTFHASFAGSANGEAESPDALQEVNRGTWNTSQAGQVPLHQASGSRLAGTILGGRDTTTKSAGRSRQTFVSGRAKQTADRDFQLRRLRYGTLPTDYDYKITIQQADRSLAICQQDKSLLTNDKLLNAFPLGRVVKILQGSDGCTKAMLAMTQTQVDLDNKMYLELVSEKECCDFVVLVQNLAGGHPDIISKDRQVLLGCHITRPQLTLLRNYMDNAFENYVPPQSTRKRLMNPDERPPASLQLAKDSVPRKATYSRVKCTDQLQSLHPISGSRANGTTFSTKPVINSEDGPAGVATGQISPENGSPRPSGRPAPPASGGILSKFFQQRTTRSSAVSSVPLDGYDTETVKPKVKFSQTGELGTPWKKPLVYPKSGKKRETVDFHDLERLDDDEFLNDNLIGFYLRYLEHYLEKEKPEVAKKVYFFNSYFFERLTQSQKGVKGINYAAVQKWTRTVDIFSRDFVVVPVNENLHWYVAIICNLPNLRRKLADDDEEDEVESNLTSDPILATKGESGDKGQAKQEAEEPDGEARSSFAGLSLGDNGKELPANQETPVVVSDVRPYASPKTKKGPGRRKSARRSLNKIDPNKPVVITLDSLGLSRTVTRTALKDYVVEEGKAKRSLDLDRGALDGVTAKGIPTQKNYSDCGLFLCAYMERFVLDPYQFVHDILQRDMDEGKDWPMMGSDELRSRLRNVLMELHRQQESEAEVVPIPDVGRILLRRRSLPPTQPECEPDLQEIPPETFNPSVDLADQEAASQVNSELTVAAGLAMQAMPSPELSQGAALKSAEDAVNRPSPGKSKPASRRAPQAAIVIPDDSPNSPVPRRTWASFRSRTDIGDDFIDEPKDLADNPQALADKLQRERSPTTLKGHGRSVSVTTDFLSGDQSYARDLTPEEMPGAWDNGEVPETQSQDAGNMRQAAEVDAFPDQIIDGL